MDKNICAQVPPMGWNSWDCYGASVTENEIKNNADYMAKHLKEYGWEYVVCDIQWYEPTADSTSYHSFADLEMDSYGRLLPAENRFPSAKNGQGFKPLADYIHELGLKFGIHIMRGIPRQAVHQNTPVKNCSVYARDIAHPYSICSWNTDMYGVNAVVRGAQDYYNSLFELYAEWGVDFVKVDDICVTYYQPHNMYSAKEEMTLIRKAIEHCGRPMVLSVSPGPALLQEAEHLSQTANMWRITNDLWDRWEDILEMFGRCREWSSYVKPGCWPDCDMLPIGHISLRGNEHGKTERYTNLSCDEQITMMTLWCIFRSPLMLGCELNDNDAFTLELLTNQEVLNLQKTSIGAREVYNYHKFIIWQSRDRDNNHYLACFNLENKKRELEVSLERFQLYGKYVVRDLWKKEDVNMAEGRMITEISAHGAVLFRLSPQ